jgi:hypothetical protein
MQGRTKSVRFAGSLMAIVILAGMEVSQVAADSITPVSSSVGLDAQVTAGAEGIGPATATDPVSQSQGATINALSVTTSATSTGGGGSLSGSGTLTSSWSSASAGTLNYSNMTIQINNLFTGFYTLSDLNDWRYTFQSNVSGTFNLSYLVTQSATFGLPTEDAWRFVWDNGSGPVYTYFGSFVDPTDSGSITQSIQAGVTYTVGIDNSVGTNFAGGFAYSDTQIMNGTFDWNIAQTSVPEPSSLALFSLGVVGCAGCCWLRVRFRRAAGRLLGSS